MAWAGIIGAALFGRAAAQVGSWQTLAGYQTASDVESHSMIDLDMDEFEDKVGEYDTNANWITEALMIYTNGGNGGNGNSIKGSGAIRTLKGFATKDYAMFTGNYAEQLPPIYTAYWAANGYTASEAAFWADTFITKDYSAIVQPAGSNQLMKKGANYQAVWMYVLHELEDAIGDCFAGDIYANDATPTGGAPHAWDEGWAFYAGSTVAATAAGAVTDDGTLIWELAEKRGYDFGTTHATGPATVNVNLLAEFIKGRDLIIAADCAAAEPVIDEIIKQMSIPLIQGTLKYAYQADPTNSAGDCSAEAANTAMTASAGCAKSWAEGWAFAAAILPRIDQCSSTAAKTVKDNLDIAAAAPMAGGFAVVQSAIESTYACLGITCADVGTRSGFAECTDAAVYCPAEAAAFQDCASKQQSLDDDFFADDDDGDDDDFSPNTCADVQQFISNGMCVEGPAVCQTEYEAYVECLYEDMAQSFLGLTCDLSCSPAAGDSPAAGGCRGPSACGCSDNQFCNFDYGSSGGCESCSSFSSAAACGQDGLPSDGEDDCVACCFGSDSPAAGDLGSDAAQRTTAALGTLLGTTVLLLAL